MFQEKGIKIKTLAEYNNSVYLLTGVLTGREYRRKRRKESQK